MKVFIVFVMAVQFVCFGAGCWQLTQPDLFAFGLFNVIVNAAFIRVSINTLINM